MDRAATITELRGDCDQISRLITRMHPALPKLGDAGTQGEVLKALFELTKQVEVVKKQLMRLEKRDDSAEL
jgi:hypothetical protein